MTEETASLFREAARRTRRRHLRIVPGRCAGEPHLLGTRLTTRTIAALAERGYGLDTIAALYPDEDVDALGEALSFEQRLARAAS